MKIFIIILLIAGAAAVLIAMYRSGQPVKTLVKSVFQGVLSLIAVNVTGLATGVTLSLNWYTILAVSVLGLPGTAALTILKFFFR